MKRTQQTSILLGTILLKLDRAPDKISTPLRDSSDLVDRGRALSDSHDSHKYAVSSFDFHSLYTHVTRATVHNAFVFDKGWLEPTPDPIQDLTEGAIALLQFLCSPLGKQRWDEHCVHFPFLSIGYTQSLTVGEVLLNRTSRCLGWKSKPSSMKHVSFNEGSKCHLVLS